MSDGHRRAFQLQRGVIDLETGEFPLILASNGEASDGHIIDVGKMEVGERIPMFSNHNADPMQRMGGLIEPHVSGKKTRKGGAFLHMVGVIDMVGDGQLPDIRRDVAQGISLGDITQMSLRWDDLDPPVARASLDKKHFAFSEAGADSWNTPMFFPRTEAREGSIVGLAADKAAIIGRSRDLSKPSHVREFYEILARGGDPEEMIDDLCAVCTARELEGHLPSTDEIVQMFYALPEASRTFMVDTEGPTGEIETVATVQEALAALSDGDEEDTNELRAQLDAARTNERPEEVRTEDTSDNEQPAPEEATAEDTPAREQPALEPDSRELLDLLKSIDVSGGLPDGVDLLSLLGTRELPESTLSMIEAIEREEAQKTVLRAAATIREVDYAKLGKV